MTVAPHFDEASNIAVVAAGKRRFTFFPPEQIKNLYIGPLDFTPSGQPISLVNLRDPDLKRFPRYEEAYKNAMSVELNPGDAIYIPSP
ncbi:cupin-like domain-containing protein [Paraglaciecola psychrophila]|uniref:Transcription factor jumonji jmjC domain-containing protein n=1 Tax=Paraglaciecola psychrophila 170 TaxID=1129794 RepID=M4RL96_9ALTE|nr:cupin-like domain-containing protein [Paraglaciecola psychrophila]AGH44341.1 transcription factor jumonji jmjC domain-containing protein [Paraglaciecola psychrophila 170]